MPAAAPLWIIALRFVAAAAFVYVGTLHFIHLDFFQKIVPPIFPAPALLVMISGVCEIAGGLGLLIPPLRVAAGWGLIALLIAVFPANIYMALRPDAIPDLHVRQSLLWLRLPLQAVIIYLVHLAARN
jgi:uncharacterized membrane protein